MKVTNIIFMIGFLISLIGLATNPLTGQISVCTTDADFTGTVSNAYTTAPYLLEYVLVQSDGITVEASNTSGTFITPAEGSYTLYAVNHDGNAVFTAWPPTGTTCFTEINQAVTVAVCPSTITACNTAADFTATASAANTTDPGYVLEYVLVQSNGTTVEEVSATGTFAIPAEGAYTLYAVNHDGNAVFTAWPPTGTTCYTEINQAVTIEDCCGPANVVLAPSGSTAVPSRCDDGVWTYYYNPSNPSDVLFAIEWAPDGTLANTTEKANALVTITKDPTYHTSPVAGTGETTWTMERYWNVTISGVHGTILTEPVNVKFFYDMAEYNAIINAATAAATAPNPYEGIQWFKTTGKVFDPPVDNNTGENVNGGAIVLTNTNTGGLTENGVLYAQFNGVTSFSGGTATTGIGPEPTPLPVELLSFRGQTEGSKNRLIWTTSSEVNSSHFEVEHSRDGAEFNYLGRVNAQGESSSPVDYRLIDEDPFSISYYRLKMVDLDGTYEYSNTVTIKRELDKSLFISNIKPVPTIDQITVEFVSYAKGKVSFKIIDLNGKLLEEIEVDAHEGDNEYSYDFSAYLPGMYVITIGNEYGRDVKRMIKN